MASEVLEIIDGVGFAAAAESDRRVVVARDPSVDQDHIPVLIDAPPDIPDRVACIAGRRDGLGPLLQETARALVGLGAMVIVIPCNTVTVCPPAAQDAVSSRVLDWVQEPSAGLVWRRPECRRVGLLATTGLLSAGLYQRALGMVKCPVVVKSSGCIRDLMDTIHAIKPGQYVLADVAEGIVGVIAELKHSGAEVTLIAYTDFSLTTAGEGLGTALQTYHATDLGVATTVRRAGYRLTYPDRA